MQKNIKNTKKDGGAGMSTKRELKRLHQKQEKAQLRIIKLKKENQELKEQIETIKRNFYMGHIDIEHLEQMQIYGHSVNNLIALAEIYKKENIVLDDVGEAFLRGYKWAIQEWAIQKRNEAKQKTVNDLAGQMLKQRKGQDNE